VVIATKEENQATTTETLVPPRFITLTDGAQTIRKFVIRVRQILWGYLCFLSSFFDLKGLFATLL
jgi:hypothetical protein